MTYQIISKSITDLVAYTEKDPIAWLLLISWSILLGAAAYCSYYTLRDGIEAIREIKKHKNDSFYKTERMNE